MGWLAFDILVSLGLVAVSSRMGYLGVHVTLHPPDEAAKPKLKRQFIILAFLVCALTVVQGIRIGISQNELITTIKNNPPKVEVTNNIPPATVITDTTKLENAQLKERAFLLAAQIRKLSGEERNEEMEMMSRDIIALMTGILANGSESEKQEYKNRSSREHSEMSKRYVQKYRDSYMADAKSVRESLLKKLPPGSRYGGLVWAYDGAFGEENLDKVATDLESLAKMLPDT